MEQAEHHSRHRRDYKNPRCPARDRKSKRIDQLAGHFPCTIPQISLPPYLLYNKTSHDNDVPQGLLLLPLYWLCSV